MHRKIGSPWPRTGIRFDRLHATSETLACAPHRTGNDERAALVHLQTNSRFQVPDPPEAPKSTLPCAVGGCPAKSITGCRGGLVPTIRPRAGDSQVRYRTYRPSIGPYVWQRMIGPTFWRGCMNLRPGEEKVAVGLHLVEFSVISTDGKRQHLRLQRSSLLYADGTESPASFATNGDTRVEVLPDDRFQIAGSIFARQFPQR